MKAKKSNSKPKLSKVSPDLRNKKRQDNTDNKIKEHSNNVEPNIRENDIQADVETEEMKEEKEEMKEENEEKKEENEEKKEENEEKKEENEEIKEEKEEKKENSDIKEVLTNASAEKSHNSSCVIEDLSETRIKNTYYQKPLDLIEEYRSTIMERYTQRVLDNVEPDPSHAPALSNYNTYMASKHPIVSENKRRQISSLPQSIASSKRTSIDRNSHVVEKSATERKRPKSCKKRTQKKALAPSSLIIGQIKNRQEGNFEGSANLNRTSRSFTKSSTKRKVNVRKQIDNAAACITIGELIKFYTTRKPTKEDLNIIQICMALIHSQMGSQLFKIGVESPEDIKKITWKTARSFIETHVKAIVPMLRDLPQRFYSDEKHVVLRELIILNNHKLKYENNSSIVLSGFINACSSLYKNYIKRAKKEYGIPDSSSRYEYTIDMYNAPKTYETNKPPVPEVFKNEPINHPSEDSAHAQTQPVKAHDTHSHVIINYTKYDTPKKHNFAIAKPSELPLNLPEKEHIILDGKKSPLASIEEQLAGNEYSKESLPGISNEQLEQYLKEELIEDLKEKNEKNEKNEKKEMNEKKKVSKN
jgi:hypothetical protein